MPPQHNKGKYRRPACYGKIFPTSEAATAYSVEHGFSQVFYGRPSAFITLRLSPATRRYLKSIPDVNARWDALGKIVLHRQYDEGRYFQNVRFQPCFAKTRIEWNLYLQGDFAQLRAIRSGKLAHEAVTQILGPDAPKPTPMPTAVGYIVRSAINPAMIYCTDGHFHADKQCGPGGWCAKVYKTERRALMVRNGYQIAVEAYNEQ